MGMFVLVVIAVFSCHVSFDMCPLTLLSFDVVAILYRRPLTRLGLYFDVVVLCHRCPSLAPASEEPENEDSRGEAEDGFTWKDVLKAVLRLRQKDKLSEGEPGVHEPKKSASFFFSGIQTGGAH